MKFLRGAARTLLAGYFVINGVKAWRKPDEVTDDAQPLASTISRWANKAIPPTAAVHLPEAPQTWVRICGATQVVAGAMLATGVGRRVGAAVLSTTMVVKLIGSRTLPHGGTETFTENAAVLGGVILAALDTQGRPSREWKKAQAAALEAEPSTRRRLLCARKSAGKREEQI